MKTTRKFSSITDPAIAKKLESRITETTGIQKSFGPDGVPEAGGAASASAIPLDAETAKGGLIERQERPTRLLEDGGVDGPAGLR